MTWTPTAHEVEAGAVARRQPQPRGHPAANRPGGAGAAAEGVAGNRPDSISGGEKVAQLHPPRTSQRAQRREPSESRSFRGRRQQRPGPARRPRGLGPGVLRRQQLRRGPSGRCGPGAAGSSGVLSRLVGKLERAARPRHAERRFKPVTQQTEQRRRLEMFRRVSSGSRLLRGVGRRHRRAAGPQPFAHDRQEPGLNEFTTTAKSASNNERRVAPPSRDQH